MKRDEVQKLIELTPEQDKAFSALSKAVKRCRKENILFYQCMETLGALNGNNVDSILCPDDRGGERGSEEMSLHFLSFPCVETECSFADDTHYVVLK